MNKLSLLVLLFPATVLAQVPNNNGNDEDDDDAAPPVQQPLRPGQPPQPGAYPQPQQYQYPAQQQYQYPAQGQYPQQPYRYPQNGYPQNQYPAQNPPAQYQQNQYRYPSTQYPQGQYPQNQYQYPQQQYPQNQYQYPQQQYPQNQYPGYPNAPGNRAPEGQGAGAAAGRDAYGRPYSPAAPQPPQVIAPPVKLALSSANELAKTDALACADAVENYHLDVARAKCADALAKDANLALAHLWMAEAAATPTIAKSELGRAADLARTASGCERGLVDGYRAWKEARIPDARRVYDQLVAQCGGERRVYVARGQFRQSALGELDGAIEDYRKAVALDEKVGASQNFLGFALADQGKIDEAEVALKRYAMLSPSEPNAHDSLASLALRVGDSQSAIAEEHKALTLDPRFVVAHGTLGDALLGVGKAKEARKEYALLEAADDAALHHDGAMRSARSMLWEDHTLDAERALVREADSARKAGRLDQAADAFLDAVRIQLERGAVAEAGRGIKEAADALRKTPGDVSAAASFDETDRRRLTAELLEARAMALSSIGERELGDARVEELAAQLKAAGDPRADQRTRGLRGWMAWRLGDDKAAIAALDKAATPALRFTWALALARNGDAVQARSIMEELAKRAGNDLDTALSRPRAAAWLKVAAPSSSSAK